MDPFTMVVAIVGITAAASVIRAKYAKQHRGEALGVDDPDAERMRADLSALQARVATLERIATDGASSLDREIEALRTRKEERLDR